MVQVQPCIGLQWPAAGIEVALDAYSQTRDPAIARVLFHARAIEVLVIETAVLVGDLYLRLDTPAFVEGPCLARFKRGGDAACLTGNIGIAVRARIIALLASLQDAVEVPTVGIHPGRIGRQILRAQMVAAHRRDEAMGIALDVGATVQVAHVDARMPGPTGPQVGAQLQAADVSVGLGLGGAGLFDVEVAVDHTGPGTMRAVIQRLCSGPGKQVGNGRAIGLVAHALVQVTQHGQVGLAQLCRQACQQRDFGAIGGHLNDG
ncbi:hypothetical protein D3C81_1124620 [compost metagenome]